MESRANTPDIKGQAISRRTFSKRTLAGIAGIAAAPMFMPQTAKGANERLILGLIGAGGMATHLSGRFGGAGIAAVCDVDLGRAGKLAERVGTKDVYQDYRKLLERDDIDAVVIATPQHWHALQSIHAAQAGKDIYCEKPMTYSVVEGRRVVEAVRKYGCVFQTGSQQRSGHNEHTGITHVRNGTIGKITKVIASNYRSAQRTRQPREKIPEELDWDMFCGPAIKPPYNFVIRDNGSKPSWSGIERFSGGDMADWGSHGLDLAQWGLGMDESGPEEVWVEGEPFKPMYSTAENPGERRGGPNKPTVFMTYPDGIVMEFTGHPESGVTFVGEKGQLRVTRGGYQSDPRELVRAPLEDPGEEIYRGYQYALDTSHQQNWLDCVKDRSDPVASAEVGHRTATICHLGNIARWVSEVTGETGNKLKWDAKKERFTNCELANSFYLDPPRRKGFELPSKV